MSKISAQSLALTPWIGLCPALALARTAMDGLALGVAVLAMGAMVLPGLAFVRRAVPAWRWPLTAVVLASAAGCVQMLLDASLPSPRDILAWGVPLLAAHLALWRAAPPFDTAPGHPARNIVLAAVLVAAMGAVREFLAAGASPQALFAHRGIWLAGQACGTLFLLALILAAQQAWQLRRRRQDIDAP